jgi:hypothetical protein
MGRERLLKSNRVEGEEGARLDSRKFEPLLPTGITSRSYCFLIFIFYLFLFNFIFSFSIFLLINFWLTIQNPNPFLLAKKKEILRNVTRKILVSYQKVKFYIRLISFIWTSHRARASYYGIYISVAVYTYIYRYVEGRHFRLPHRVPGYIFLCTLYTLV